MNTVLMQILRSPGKIQPFRQKGGGNAVTGMSGKKNSVTGLFSPGAGCADRAVPAETGYTRSEEICQ